MAHHHQLPPLRRLLHSRPALQLRKKADGVSAGEGLEAVADPLEGRPVPGAFFAKKSRPRHQGRVGQVHQGELLLQTRRPN